MTIWESSAIIFVPSARPFETPSLYLSAGDYQRKSVLSILISMQKMLAYLWFTKCGRQQWKNRVGTEIFSQSEMENFWQKKENFWQNGQASIVKQFRFSRSSDFNLFEPILVRPPVNNPDTAHKVISFLFSWQKSFLKSSKISRKFSWFKTTALVSSWTLQFFEKTRRIFDIAGGSSF